MACLVKANPFVTLRRFFSTDTTKTDTHPLQERVDLLVKQLRESDRLTPKQALTDPLVLSARAFSKTLDPKNLPKGVKLLETETLAGRLGITSEQLYLDSEFPPFVKQTQLYNYIAEFDHKIGYDGQELLLGPAGKQRRWSKVKELALEKAPVNPGFSVQPLRYGMNGIQEVTDLYSLENGGLRVVDRVEPTGRNLLRMRLTIGSEPQLTGNHAYYDLIASTGEVYCPGLYRPEKRDNPQSSNAPCRVQYGRIMNGDYSRWCNVDEEVLEIEVDDEDFNRIKTTIEEDLKKAHRFHTLGTNCTDWDLKILRIRKDTFIPECKDFVPRILLPSRVVKFTDAHFGKLPAVVQKVCMQATVIFFNIVLIYLGAFRVDENIKNAIPGVKAHMTSWWDIFDKEKLMLSSPFRLGKEFFPKIREWRVAEEIKLRGMNASQDEIDRVKLKLPPKEFWESMAK